MSAESTFLTCEQILSAWEKAIKILSKELVPASFDTWIAPVVPEAEGNTLVLFCPNEFGADWLNSRYKSLLLKTVQTFEPAIEDIVFRKVIEDKDNSRHLAPTWQHQVVLGELFRQFANYLASSSCRVFTSPFALRLPELDEQNEEVSNIFQPDITIICDSSKLKGTVYCGTPTVVVEITSTSTGKMDKLYKFNKYEKAGVKEYWIVEPEVKIVSVFVLQNTQRYGRPEVYSDEDKIPLSTFPDLAIDLKPVFGDI